MKLSSYERILRFVPIFHRDIFEFDAIYRVDGEMIDELLLHIDIVKLNRFILTANEDRVSDLEDFLEIKNDEVSLDERKSIILSYVNGFGKLSASKIQSLIKSLSGAESVVDFLPADSEGNNCLDIKVLEPKCNSVYSIMHVLSKRIPAHIWYKIKFEYSKNIQNYVGIAMQSGSYGAYSVTGSNLDDYRFLADEDGALLLDEAGRLLLD